MNFLPNICKSNNDHWSKWIPKYNNKSVSEGDFEFKPSSKGSVTTGVSFSKVPKNTRKWQSLSIPCEFIFLQGKINIIGGKKQ